MRQKTDSLSWLDGRRVCRMSQRNGSANEFTFVMRTKRIMIIIWASGLASSGGNDATFTMSSQVFCAGEWQIIVFSLDLWASNAFSYLRQRAKRNVVGQSRWKMFKFWLNHHPPALTLQPIGKKSASFSRLFNKYRFIYLFIVHLTQRQWAAEMYGTLELCPLGIFIHYSTRAIIVVRRSGDNKW